MRAGRRSARPRANRRTRTASRRPPTGRGPAGRAGWSGRGVPLPATSRRGTRDGSPRTGRARRHPRPGWPRSPRAAARSGPSAATWRRSCPGSRRGSRRPADRYRSRAPARWCDTTPSTSPLRRPGLDVAPLRGQVAAAIAADPLEWAAALAEGLAQRGQQQLHGDARLAEDDRLAAGAQERRARVWWARPRGRAGCPAARRWAAGSG